MGIEIRQESGLHVPRVVCNVCGKFIEDGQGGVAMRLDRPADEPEFAHKGRCLDWILDSRRESGQFMGWTELATFFADLLGNAGFEAGEPEFTDQGTFYRGEPIKRKKKAA